MKKKILSISVLLVIMMLAFSGCSKSDNPAPAGDTPGQTETPTESTPYTEPEATPTATPEAVNYSAEDVMKLVDELIVKYPYNKPEHIKALVIAANLDYISKEDMDILLETYKYTIEDLAKLYDECVLDNGEAVNDTFDYYKGNVAEISPEHKYTNRITLQDACLNETDVDAAKWFDIFLTEFATCKSIREKEEELFSVILSPDTNVDALSSFERTCYNYTSGVYMGNFDYAHYIPSPYIGYE